MENQHIFYVLSGYCRIDSEDVYLYVSISIRQYPAIDKINCMQIS